MVSACNSKPFVSSWLRATFFSLFVLFAAPAHAQMPTPPDRKAEPTHRDIAYAPPMPATSKGHLLDLYIPAGISGPKPVVIWTSGSAFFGDNGKEGARYMAPELLAAGFAVAGVSVRSSSQTKFPGNLHDIKAAIRYLRANAAKYDLDPNRIAIMGDSSGGWTTAMAALTGDASEMEGSIGTTGVSSAVQAAIAFYPPTDFLTMDSWAPTACIKGNARPGPGMCHDDPKSPESLIIGCAIQTCPAKVRLADPAQYVSPKDAPMMILHGRADALVPHQQGERLFKRLAQKCNEAIFYSLPMAGHGPAWSFLEDAKFKAGATVEGASRTSCKVAPPKLDEPGWPAIISFLKDSLK
jgi:acetyl esterase/lipase